MVPGCLFVHCGEPDFPECFLMDVLFWSGLSLSRALGLLSLLTEFLLKKTLRWPINLLAVELTSSQILGMDRSSRQSSSIA